MKFFKLLASSNTFSEDFASYLADKWFK